MPRNTHGMFENQHQEIPDVVDGELLTPLGRRVSVRTVWIVEGEEEIPRFVTAYPQTGE